MSSTRVLYESFEEIRELRAEMQVCVFIMLYFKMLFLFLYCKGSTHVCQPVIQIQ